MGDTISLDGSGVEDCASLLNSNASSIRTADINLVSLGLILCILLMLVAVVAVSCLLSALTSSHS